MIKRFLRKALAARQNRVVARYHDFVNSFSSLSPQLVPGLPPGEKVVIFSPHCDDESLGCGGTLYKHHRQGHAIDAIFMTDGSMCDSQSEIREIVEIRKEEARKASEVLGIGRCIFLDYPDRRLKATPQAIDQVTDLLQKSRPDLVYLPFYLDNHPDHMATAIICLEAIRRRPVRSVFFYEIWTAMIPNHLVDIGGAMDKKLEAIRVYRSQKGIDEFAEKTRSLNHYRSLLSGGRFQYAEALLKTEEADWQNILRQLHAR
ncbi:MAG: PIG-L family deacetylase [Nitrospinae bacterium]|nr:PIG-L family deacetylase [Nitrospinota bacterium]